jgi:hypothetical protein
MVDLVLQADGQQTRGLDCLLPAVEVQIADDDMFGTLDLVVYPGHRQAAFFADLQPVLLEQISGLIRVSN